MICQTISSLQPSLAPITIEHAQNLSNLSLEPNADPDAHIPDQLPNRPVRLPKQTPAQHACPSRACNPREQPTSASLIPDVPSTSASMALATPFGQSQLHAKVANTAPEPRRIELTLENLTSRKHARPLQPPTTAATSTTAAARKTDGSLNAGPRPSASGMYATPCSLMSSPGESTASASVATATSASAAALSGPAQSAPAEATALYPSDGPVQPLRMLARPPRGNTVRAFHGLKHIKDVPFAELLRLQVCRVNFVPGHER